MPESFYDWERKYKPTKSEKMEQQRNSLGFTPEQWSIQMNTWKRRNKGIHLEKIMKKSESECDELPGDCDYCQYLTKTEYSDLFKCILHDVQLLKEENVYYQAKTVRKTEKV